MATAERSAAFSRSGEMGDWSEHFSADYEQISAALAEAAPADTPTPAREEGQ